MKKEILKERILDVKIFDFENSPEPLFRWDPKFRWSPGAIIGAHGCHERFLRKYVLFQKRERIPDEVKIEEDLIFDIVVYLKTRFENFESFLNSLPEVTQKVVKEIKSWKKDGWVMTDDTLRTDDLESVTHILFENKSKYIIIMIKNRKDNRIQKNDLVRLFTSLYLTQKRSYRDECYIGILAIQSEQPLNIIKSPLVSIEDLEKFVKQEIKDARIALLTEKHYDKRFCKICEYPSCPEYSA